MTPQIFQNTFFARNMHQSFNAEAERFESDDYEPAVRKWLRSQGGLISPVIARRPGAEEVIRF